MPREFASEIDRPVPTEEFCPKEDLVYLMVNMADCCMCSAAHLEATTPESRLRIEDLYSEAVECSIKACSAFSEQNGTTSSNSINSGISFVQSMIKLGMARPMEP